MLNSRDISVRHLLLGCQNSTGFPKKQKVALEAGSSHHPREIWECPNKVVAAQLNAVEQLSWPQMAAGILDWNGKWNSRLPYQMLAENKHCSL